MSDSPKLTLIVAREADTPDVGESKQEDFEEQALPGFGWLRRAPKDVDLGKLQKDLKRVQGQVDQLLGSVDQSSAAGFRLNSVEVSLAISAEGSIGVVTAGVEASIALSFERV